MRLIDENVTRLQAELHELRAEHRDLNQIIDQMEMYPSEDDLLLRRLKKRKLALKDQIEAIEQRLVPDIPA